MTNLKLHSGAAYAHICAVIVKFISKIVMIATKHRDRSVGDDIVCDGCDNDSTMGSSAMLRKSFKILILPMARRDESASENDFYGFLLVNF